MAGEDMIMAAPTAGGIKAATRHSEGAGEGDQAGRGSGDSFIEFQTDSKDRQTGQGGRGQGSRP